MSLFLKRYSEMGAKFDPRKISVRPALRVNTLKINVADLKKRLNARLEKIESLSQGYYFASPFAVGAMPEHFLGMIYLQDAASQIPAEVLDPQPGETVLDMAASPGSKTTQMAALMNNKGILIALDSNNLRLPALKNNLERCGVKNCLVYKKDAVYADDFKIEFDRVLLDAPCSGNFAIEEGWLDKRNLADLPGIVKEQRRLIHTAMTVLKKGGVLVYSTCSLEPEENEENIDWLLNNYPEARLEKVNVEIGEPGIVSPLGKPLHEDVELCRRLWPHKTGTQGFFIAKIRKI